MINFDYYTNKNKTEHNLKWPYIPDHPYRTLIIGGCGSGKTNALLNLINNQPDIDKIHLYAKDPYETKYQYFINKCQKAGLNHYDDPKAFIADMPPLGKRESGKKQTFFQSKLMEKGVWGPKHHTQT